MSKEQSEVQKAFQEGTNAVLIVIQMVCPECNKLVRLKLLVDDKGMVKQ